MRTRSRLLVAATSLAAAAALLTACSTPATGDVEAGASATAPAVVVTTPAATEASTPEESASPEPTERAIPTCEELLLTSLVDSLTEQGWTARSEPFYIGSTELKRGVSCIWGDFSGTSNDSAQIYGWAELTDDEAKKAQNDLLAGGWKREKAEAGTYITMESPSDGLVDENGYGMTYYFGDGTVTVADTKQALLLISAPE